MFEGFNHMLPSVTRKVTLVKDYIQAYYNQIGYTLEECCENCNFRIGYNICIRR